MTGGTKQGAMEGDVKEEKETENAKVKSEKCK